MTNIICLYFPLLIYIAPAIIGIMINYIVSDPGVTLKEFLGGYRTATDNSTPVKKVYYHVFISYEDSLFYGDILWSERDKIELVESNTGARRPGPSVWKYFIPFFNAVIVMIFFIYLTAEYAEVVWSKLSDTERVKNIKEQKNRFIDKIYNKRIK